MGLTIKQGDTIFLDTAPFIYFFEQHPVYFPFVERLFNEAAAYSASIITSIITFIEITTLPARLGNQDLVNQYREYFTNSAQITLLPVDLLIANKAIELRAQYNLKAPDVIQLGTAIVSSASHIITNDKQWKQFVQKNVLLIDEI